MSKFLVGKINLLLALFSFTFYIQDLLSSPNILKTGFEELEMVSMPYLDNKLPDAHKLALKRINQYRLAMKLPEWIYDPSLSKMAQAHADYVLLNCNAGRKGGGHYEDPKWPGYTKEGHEAASSSGLSGGPDPLYGLERLIEGVFHRVQFLNPDKMRVGVGFTYDFKSFCGSTLFVSRPILNNDTMILTRASDEKKYLVFPPDGFQDTLTHFISEWPDPRPAKISIPSGYMASVSLNSNQIKNLKNTKSIVTDSQGNQIDIWETNPVNPTYKKPPSGMDQIYVNGSNVNPFSDNFNMVFIMPKSPLKSNETYQIKSKIIYTDREDEVSWSFTTRGNYIWKVSPTNNRLDSDNLSLVTTHSISNDTYLLSDDLFSIDKPYWFDKSLNIIGSSKTKINVKPGSLDKGYLFNFSQGGEFLLKNLEFDQDSVGYIFVDKKSKVKIENCSFSNNTKNAFLVSSGGFVLAESTQFSKLGSKAGGPFCIHGKTNKELAGEFIFGKDNSFSNISNNTSDCGASTSKLDKIWSVSTNPQSQPKAKLSFTDAIELLSDGEEIILDDGNYEFEAPKWIGGRNLTIRGKDKNATIISTKPNEVFLLYKKASLSLEQVNLKSQCALFAIKPETSLKLNRINLTTSSLDCFFSVLEGNGTIEIKNSNFENYQSRFFLYSHSDQAKILLRENNIYPKKYSDFVFIGGKIPK